MKVDDPHSKLGIEGLQEGDFQPSKEKDEMRIWEAIYKTHQIHNYKKKLRG